MLRTRHLAVALPIVLAGAHAAAQVAVFETQFEGELDDASQDALREALFNGLDADGRLDVLSEAETAELLGDAAACESVECAVEGAAGQPVSVGVIAEVYGEAEIYDFSVRIFRLDDGSELARQPGECTFCPIAEAVEVLRFTAESTLDSVPELPAPPAAVAETTTETTGTTDTPPPEPAAPAFLPGDVRVVISTAPANAEIRVNGQIVGRGTATLDVAPQDLEIVARADRHADATDTLRVAAGAPMQLRLVLPSESGASRAARSTGGDADFNRAAVGGITAGVGGAMLVGGIVALAFDGQTTCASGPVSACAELYETTGLGVALTALGGIGVGTGLGLLLSGRGDGAEATALDLAPSRSGAVVRLRARF